jgi:hypothetical protein
MLGECWGSLSGQASAGSISSGLANAGKRGISPELTFPLWASVRVFNLVLVVIITLQFFSYQEPYNSKVTFKRIG